MSRDLFFADFEVFAHDWLFCAKRQSDGKVVGFWNDPDEMHDFIEAFDPVLCGFNFRDYDSYILKGVLLGWTPQQIKIVNDTIIENDDRTMTWRLFNDSPWVTLPPVIDLFHDISPRKGLKELEAMMGLSIVESSVPFNIDRPLTTSERESVEVLVLRDVNDLSEREEVARYCFHDIEATEQLYGLRFGYLKSKTALCESVGIDPLTMLKHTNARVVSEVLEAQRLGEHPFETYEVPDNVDRTAIPAEVLAFVESINTENCMDNTQGVEFMFHDCPTVVGLGGIHAAVPKYKETASDERVILLQDIGSYYPSLIINNGYMSRAVPDASAYDEFYRMRMKAKADGDTDAADAAKLVLNTTYGAMKDSYNKLFDPMQATRVCLSGQVYLLDLIEQLFRHVCSMQLIQLNTDGWVVSCERSELHMIERWVEKWQERTGFTVDSNMVDVIVQANVNNYVMRTVDGKVKAKGGVVACHDGPDLFYHMPQIIRNNNTIIDHAVTEYLLNDTSIEQTIAECDDLERFQIIAKAGRTFQKVVHYVGLIVDTVQRCNRVYATTDETYGGIFKLKIEDGEEVGRSKIPLTPEHCFIDNDGTKMSLTMLDRSWYVALATKKAHEFITRDKKERDQMANAKESTNELKDEDKKPAPRSRAKKEAAPEAPAPIPMKDIPFRERLLALQVAMFDAATSVSFDKAQSFGGKSSDYADTQQYKKRLAVKCSELGLVFGLDIQNTEFLGVITPEDKAKPEYAAVVEGEARISDAYSDEVEWYGVSGTGVNVTPGHCIGVAQTSLLRGFILNNFLLDNMGRDGDDVAMNNGAPTGGYVPPGEKAQIKQDIVSEKAEEAKYAPELFMVALREQIIEAQKFDETFGTTMLSKHYNEDGTPKIEKGKSTMLKATAVKGMTKAESIIAEGATKTDGE